MWVNAVKAIGDAPEGCHWVDVCDRGADTFEFLEYEDQARAALRDPLDAQPGLGGRRRREAPHLLHDLLRALDAQLGWQVKVSANKRPAGTHGEGAVLLVGGNDQGPARAQGASTDVSR